MFFWRVLVDCIAFPSGNGVFSLQHVQWSHCIPAFLQRWSPVMRSAIQVRIYFRNDILWHVALVIPKYSDANRSLQTEESQVNVDKSVCISNFVLLDWIVLVYFELDSSGFNVCRCVWLCSPCQCQASYSACVRRVSAQPVAPVFAVSVPSQYRLCSPCQ